MIINILGLGMPIVILQIYDRIIPNQSLSTLSYLMAGLMVAIAIDTALKIIRSHISGWSAAHIDYLAETEAVRRVFKGQLSTIERDPASTHIDRMNALSATAKMFAGPARMGLVDLPFIVIFLGAMFIIAPTLAYAVIALFVVFAYNLLTRARKIQHLQEEQQDLDRRKYDFVIEALSGLENIKTMSCEPQMMRRYERLQEAIAIAFHKSVRIDGVTQSLGGVFASATMVTIVSLGAYLVVNGALSFGALACCLLLGGRAVEVLVRSVRTWGELSNFDLVKKNVDELFALNDQPDIEREPVKLPSGEIQLENVQFLREGSNNALTAPISIQIPHGQILALKGGNAPDDRTLLSLMRAVSTPTAGSLSICGIGIEELVGADLSSSIAYVPQHTAIFKGTILENLTLFDTREGLQSARAASRLIGLEADIQHLPLGYDTLLGSGGSEMLPPSFQQRICIARALARRPKILVLEEANAVLDQRAEKLLQRGLTALRGSTTMIILSNRPSFLSIADTCMQLRQGELVPFEFPTYHPAAQKVDEKAAG
ncbi:ABC transporter transmembrane domain-containing protein [Maritalea porphyrae]|nr:ABC transporter transmembrane domain-containing protein [Maritalea porphyrae]MCZ4272525.1 ABC transporter transmembrane domain-containing protein [Maritalea porphyrae]